MGYLKFGIVGLLALTACTPASKALVNQAVESIKDGEDAKARLTLNAPCAITVGAFNRVLSADERRAVMSLCGGASERPATVEDLRRELGK